MRYQWLLFDADGTLFDYDNAESTALKKTFEDFGVNSSESFHGRYREINNGLFKELEKGLISSLELRTKRFDMLFSEYNLDLDVTDFSEQYLQHLSNGSMLLQGASETISLLYPDHKMMIVTNGIGGVQRPRFDNSKIKDFFENIIISEEIGVAKPAVQFFDIAFNAMGKPDKKDVLIIGDSLSSDMAGGINYGIDTCWYNPNRIPNENNDNITYEIRMLKELLQLV